MVDLSRYDYLKNAVQHELDHLMGGTGFPGVNLAHDGNEYRLVWNCVHSIYFLFKVPWVSGPNLKTGMPFWH